MESPILQMNLDSGKLRIQWLKLKYISLGRAEFEKIRVQGGNY
jgi:hypothetical protein